jgi:hypothetical protein
VNEEESFQGTPDRLVHALLCGLHDRASEVRVRLAMREIDARPRRVWGRVAAGVLVGAGMLIGTLFQTALPDAHAVMQRASRRAEETTDRQYRVTVTLLRPQAPQVVSQGTMHVRGTQAYAYQFEGPLRKAWIGSDGTTNWFLPEAGEAKEWPAGDETRWKAHNELRYASIDTYVKNLDGRFDFSTVGREGGILQLRASRKPGALSEVVTQIDFWVREDDQLIMKSLSRLEPARLRNPLLVAYEYQGASPHPSTFYTLKGHAPATPETRPGAEK